MKVPRTSRFRNRKELDMQIRGNQIECTRSAVSHMLRSTHFGLGSVVDVPDVVKCSQAFVFGPLPAIGRGHPCDDRRSYLDGRLDSVCSPIAQLDQ